MNQKVNVGQRIKKYRQRQNLTLKEIESRVAVSATHVSEIERGKTSPTIGALSKIAEALEVDAALFLAKDDVPRARVTRSSERSEVRFKSNHCTTHPISAPVDGQDLSAALVEFDANFSPTPSDAHPGEEFAYIMRGQLEVVVNGQSYELGPGDTIHFRADARHQLISKGDQVCVGIWATTPKFGI